MISKLYLQIRQAHKCNGYSICRALQWRCAVKKETEGKYTNRGYDLSQIGTTFKASCNQIAVNSGGMD